MTTTLKRRRVAERLASRHLTAAPKKTGRPPMAFFYIRYSSVEQTGNNSIDYQLQALTGLYESKLRDRGFVMAPLPYVDAEVSAYKVPFAKRPAAMRLLADVQKGDVILFYTISRCFRKSIDGLRTVASMHDRGIEMMATDMLVDWTTPMGQFIVGVLLQFAQLDSAIKGQHTKAGQRVAIQNGAHCGPPPAFVEKVYYRKRKRSVIKKPYVDALDWMAKQMRATKPASVDRILYETRKRMAEADGVEFNEKKHYGLSRSQFYDSVKPRFANWSKETGVKFEHVPQGQSEVVTRWLYPQMPSNEQAQEG